jgi:hypothetical protein
MNGRIGELDETAVPGKWHSKHVYAAQKHTSQNSREVVFSAQYVRGLTARTNGLRGNCESR